MILNGGKNDSHRFFVNNIKQKYKNNFQTDCSMKMSENTTKNCIAILF